MIIKIISGGQTGADQGGLEAAEECNVETGGFIPHRYLTEAGYNPLMGERFNLKETKSPHYPFRTELNAKTSDATIWFGHTNSPGYRTTKNFVNKYNKPLYIMTRKSTIDDICEWIKNNKIEILNVAGNRESKNKGIQKFTRNTLIEVIKLLNS